MSHGQVGLLQHEEEFVSIGHNGLAFRGIPGTRILASDVNARENLWIEAAALEQALEALLGERLRERPACKSTVDWTSELAASLRGQIDFLTGEMARQGEVTENPVAMASMTDLVVSLVLRSIPHNYLEQLGTGHFGAVPAYVRCAEDFMRANAAVQITMDNVGVAAGCSVRTLRSVFRQFRDTTPLASLHRIRLEHAHAELGGSPCFRHLDCRGCAPLRLHQCRTLRGGLPPLFWGVSS
jgi:hypothetical protein